VQGTEESSAADEGSDEGFVVEGDGDVAYGDGREAGLECVLTKQSQPSQD